MKSRAISASLRVHFFEVLVVGLMILVMLLRRPWPAKVPVHFDAHWNTDRWGSVRAMTFFPLLAIGILLSGFWASVMWSQYENGRKRFNVLLPIFAAPLGALAGVHFWFWRNLPALMHSTHAGGGWFCVFGCIVVIWAVEIPLEISREAIGDERDPPAS